MKNYVLIPARLQSKRFPEKPLQKILHKTMIRWVYEGCRGSERADEVLVITDSERIHNSVREVSGRAILLKKDYKSGTDRIADAISSLDAGLIVNVQGDEPLINGKIIDRVFELLEKSDLNTIVTPYSKIRSEDEFLNPNVVKVVIDSSNYALYFSRSPIPHNGYKSGYAYKHIGIYGYRREVLGKFVIMKSFLEDIEKLEQLRGLSNGIRFRMFEIEDELCSVDVPDDIKRVEKILKERYL